MKAAVMRATNAPMTIEDLRIDKPSAREVLIRVSAAGICQSDLHVYHGSLPYPLPTVLGHEASGVVEMVGSEVRGLKPGDHVITCVSTYCGHCSLCLDGHLAICGSSEMRRGKHEPDRLDVGGERVRQFFNLSAFAEQMLIHEHSCVRIDPDVPMDRAAIVGCGVLTGYGAVVRGARVLPGETVVILGCGGVGLAAVSAARIAGASRIIAVDRRSEKLQLAMDLGATEVMPMSDDIAREIIEVTRGGADHAIEAIGLKATAEAAYQMIRRGGTATIVGVLPAGTKLEIPAENFLMEKTLRGSAMGSNQFPTDIPRLIEFYRQGRLNLDRLVAKHIRLEDINDAFESFGKDGATRSVIMFT